LAYLPSYISRWASTTVHAHPTAGSAMQALQLAGRTSRIYIIVLPSAVLQHAGGAKKHQERCHLRPLRRSLSLPVNDVKTRVKDPANIWCLRNPTQLLSNTFENIKCTLILVASILQG